VPEPVFSAALPTVSAPHLTALAKARRLASARQDILAIDCGYAYTRGEMTARVSIRFHVAAKSPLSALRGDQVLPDAIDGVEVDVVSARYRLNAANPRLPQNRMQPGLSIGNLRSGSTGTLGAIVANSDGSQTFMLSNWHVLCGGVEAAAGDQISQPGPFDLGSNPPRPVATLERWLRLSEHYDAALARLASDTSFNEELFGTTVQPEGVIAPALGLPVVKSGSVSGVTYGVVDGVAGSYQLDYSQFGDGPEWMSGFRIVQDPAHPGPLSLEGDSGALWVDSTRTLAVGLHFAGEDEASPGGGYALAHPISEVLGKFGVNLT
jgi:hypothetical protein